MHAVGVIWQVKAVRQKRLEIVGIDNSVLRDIPESLTTKRFDIRVGSDHIGHIAVMGMESPDRVGAIIVKKVCSGIILRENRQW